MITSWKAGPSQLSFRAKKWEWLSTYTAGLLETNPMPK